MSLTLGTHNLHDETGTPTPFADAILFTEAMYSEVRDELHTTHDVHVCKRQKDLVIAVRKGIAFDVTEHYKRAHWGVRKVTPNRGTYWLEGRIHGERVALLVEHRINAAFAPFKRGEGLYRKTMWAIHTGMTLRIVKRLKARGFTIHAGGDLNTVRGVQGYRGALTEVGGGLDRLGSTKLLTDVEHLSRMGSDHNRLRARVG